MAYPKEITKFIEENIQDRPVDLARKVLKNFPHFKKTERQLANNIHMRKAKILSAIKDNATEHGLDVKDVHSGWLKNKDSSFYFKNPELDEDFQAKFKEDLLESIKDHSPNYVSIIREKSKDGHLLVIDIADLHINKYATSELTGAEYNSKLAVERAVEGTKGILEKSGGYEIDKIVFVIGNDVLNTDNLTKSTTRNTPQDTDVSWYEAFLIAKKCYVECIDLCLNISDVDVIHCPSNHDFMSGCFLAETIATHYRLCKNITFDISPSYRSFYQYHNNMLEFEHGDKGKSSGLPLIMAQQEPKMWASTKFRYSYLHHLHHSDKTQYQSSKDYVGVNVTYLRSPSSADIWHSDNGYLNMVAVEAFIHSKQNGRVAHITNYF